MSSLWFRSRRTDASLSADPSEEHPANLTSILAAAGSELPVLAPEHLSFDKILGRGSSFVVHREVYSRFSDAEPYYVAVKYIITADQPPTRLQQHYDRVVRELRILTHRNLKSNQYILKILAYGWLDSPTSRSPYLVVDYSAFGTLDTFLPRFEVSWADRRELALDVALGLRALHESKIVHGDVKPSNVLVFEAWGVVRNGMAVISDFGGAIFEQDDNDGHVMRYGGTAIYNAPEQEQRGKYCLQRPHTIERFYQADVFSFGITLWEIMKQGKNYIDDEWLSQHETKTDFLNRIYEEEEDKLDNPLLHRAEIFCDTIFRLSSIGDAVLNCFRMTLRDEPSQRSSMTQIVDALTHLNPTQRPAARHYPGRWHPPKPTKGPEQDGIRAPYTNWKLVPHTANPAVTRVDNESHELNIQFIKNVSGDARKGIMTRMIKPGSTHSSHSKVERTVYLDLFQASLMPNPPWEVQCDVVRKWHALAASTEISKRFQANLQLAICYHIGYGVRPDRDLVLLYLTASLEGNSPALILYRQLVTALTLDVDHSGVYSSFLTDLDRRLEQFANQETYFAIRVRRHQQLQLQKWKSIRHDAERTHYETLPLTELVSRAELSLLSDALSSHEYDNTELSLSLLKASQYGNADMVQLICDHCSKFVQDESLPTPLHWLIMFEKSELEMVANILVCGTSVNQIGLCKEKINSVPTTESNTVFITEHCLELFGTPLHWAVRTRNLKLVELLIRLGADINTRTEIPTAFVTEIHRPLLPGLSPLDLAVLFHLPEIVSRLLDLGANREGGEGTYVSRHSAFCCIGLACVPFSRYIIHGKKYREALRDTIQVLTKRGFDINGTNAQAYDPLKVALSNADCDSYIIEEMLGAGAFPSQRSLQAPENALDIAIGHAPFRRYSVENLRLILAYVSNINDCSFSSFNALHAAALGGSEAMVEVLSIAQGFEIDAMTPTRKDGRHGAQTALHLAAMSGSAQVIRTLVQKGANMEIIDASRYTPLQTAVFHRRVAAADALIESRASVFFEPGKRNTGDTVLHVAAAGQNSEVSLVKHLLTEHPRLRKPSILNAIDHVGWTVLHKATYFGDYEAVEILLAMGANKTLMDKSRGPMPGRTPLERVEHELWRLSIDAWDLDLKRIISRGPVGKAGHIANLQAIVCMLKDD